MLKSLCSYKKYEKNGFDGSNVFMTFDTLVTSDTIIDKYRKWVSIETLYDIHKQVFVDTLVLSRDTMSYSLKRYIAYTNFFKDISLNSVNSKVNVYSMSGQLLFKNVPVETVNTLPFPESGIYLIQGTLKNKKIRILR
jgi:hypothetical protein